MRSAYMVLGVPGNATREDIDTAFRKAQELYPRERLANEEGAMARLNEVKEAYRVLSDADARAAHDRKLAAAPRPAPRTVLEPVRAESSATGKLVAGAVLLLAVVLAAGFTISWRNAETRKVIAAQEQAAREAEAKEVERQRIDAERLAVQRRQDADRAASMAAAEDRRAMQDSRVAVARASAEIRNQEAAAAAQQRQARAEQQRQESNRQAEERRNVADARMRADLEKQRVREMCYQLYRRPDC